MINEDKLIKKGDTIKLTEEGRNYARIEIDGKIRPNKMTEWLNREHKVLSTKYRLIAIKINKEELQEGNWCDYIRVLYRHVIKINKRKKGLREIRKEIEE